MSDSGLVVDGPRVGSGFSRRFLLRTAAGGLGTLLLNSALLAACGGDDDDDDTDGPSGTVDSGASTGSIEETPQSSEAEPSEEATSRSEGSASTDPTTAGEESSDEPEDEAGDSDKVLIWGGAHGIARLNPQHSSNALESAMFDCLYDSLVHLEPGDRNTLLPGLATAWELLDDTTWQFKLRSDVEFHNGDPFTSKDVKFTVERMLDPEAQTLFATTFSLVDTIETPDDFTVVFRMKEPDPLLPNRLADKGYIIPADYFAEVDADEFERNPVGTGPFAFEDWVQDQSLTLVANERYWGEAPAIDSVELRAIPETASRLAALMTGEINFTDKLPFDQIEAVESSEDTKTIELPTIGFYGLTPNMTIPPFDDVRIRQALSLAIDRELLVETLLLGNGIVSNGPIPRGDVGYDPDIPPLPYDPDRARELLSEVGYDGTEIVLETTSNWLIANDRDLGEAIVAMWNEVGFNASLEIIEVAVRNDKVRTQAFKGLFTSNFLSYLGTPDGLMWRILQPGGTLQFGWTDEEFVRLGEEAQSSLDEDLRLSHFQRMSEIVREQMPWITLFQVVQNYGVASYIEFTPGPNYRVDFRGSNLRFGD